MWLFITIGTLAILTIASVFRQISMFHNWLSRWDKIGILPNYCFFAPNPIKMDYRLVFRYISDEDETWKEVPIYSDTRIYKFAWNPFKYYCKGIIDTCQQLLMEFHKIDNKNFIQLSTSYLRLLKLVAAQVKKEGQIDKTIRFAIVSSVYEQHQLKVNQVEFASFQHLI